MPPATGKQAINHFTTLRSKNDNTVKEDRIVNKFGQSESYNQNLDSSITENKINANVIHLKKQERV